MGEMTIQSELLALQGYAPETVVVAPGQTVEGMLRQALGVAELSPTLRDELTVNIGGQPVPSAWWGKLTPKAGVPVYVIHRPLNGGNGGAILRLAAVAALSYFTMGAGGMGASGWITGLGWGSTASWGLAAGTFMLGSLAINALIPVTNTGSSTGSEGTWNQLTGTGNQLNQWGVIPFVVGEYRVYPPKAAITYTETLGEDSWLRILLDLGYDIDEDDVEDICIGDTSIDDFSDVEYEITTSPTLYTTDVYEESVSVSMDDEGDQVQRTTAPNVTSISLDLIYTGGLFGVGTSGKKFTLSTKWAIEYRETGTSTWLTPGSSDNLRLSGMTWDASSSTFDVNAQNQKPFAVGIGWDVPVGQYDVRVTRAENGRGSSRNTYVDAATYSVLRSIKDITPSTTGTTKLAMRIKTSEDISGSVDSINCIIKPKIPVYDRETETWTTQHSVNPAWCVYWLMTTCRGLTKHVSSSRMDLEAWSDYAEFCDTYGFEARTVCDSSTTAKELINKVLGGALASIGEQGGRYRPVFDEGAAEPEWTYTMLETTGFSVSRAFTDLPQALRVQFVNPDNDYEDDEIIVLDDGYSLDGVDARGNASTAPEPTEYETLQLEMAMTAQQAWRLGRYHFAQAKYRANTYSIELDIAGIPARRGALVAVPHDVIDSCIGVGRAVRVQTSDVPSGYAAMLVCDEIFETETGTSYKVEIRSADGRSTQVLDCHPASPLSAHLLLPSVPTVEAGDAVILYQASREIAKVLVTNVSFGSNYATTLTAVDYDARVLPYWQNPPEIIVSQVTGTTYDTPSAPTIAAVVSSTTNDASDDATIKTATVHIAFQKSSGYVAEAA